MELLLSIFIILIALAVAESLAGFIPKFSANYIHLAAGIVLGLLPFTNTLILDFDNELFMIFILAPLIFFEGQNTPMLLVKTKLKRIIGLAMGLVIISAVAASELLHLSFHYSLALGLILVAIATPTDATAFASVTSGQRFSKEVEKNLKLEALFNDATGLILLQAGILWYTSGELPLLKNFFSLAYSAIGGMLVGIILAFLIMSLRQFLIRTRGNEIAAQTLFFLLTPFLVYLAAEKLGVSGIIAVVFAGVVSNSEATRSRFSEPRQMHLGLELGNFTAKILNRFVFIILGLNLTRVLLQEPATFLKKFHLAIRWRRNLFIFDFISLVICPLFYGRTF